MTGLRALYLASLETSVALVPFSYSFTQASILGISFRTLRSYVDDQSNETASSKEVSTLPYVNTIKVMDDTRRAINDINFFFQLTGAKLILSETSVTSLDITRGLSIFSRHSFMVSNVIPIRTTNLYLAYHCSNDPP